MRAMNIAGPGRTTMSSTKTVDILVIGAGPAGLALANWFRNSGISVLLVDKKSGPTPRGHAEGLKSTTNEIFDTFGIGPQIAAESWRLEEIAIWGPALDGSGGVVRERVVQDKVEELGKIRETMLQQSRVEHYLLQNVLTHQNIKILYNLTPVSVHVDENRPHSANSYPVEVCLSQEKTGPGGTRSVGHTLYTKYVVGCDGAHSWLRKQLKVSLEGDLTDSVFGVIDIVPKSNFPDIRRVSYIRAATGTVLLVPRSNKEVRLYIPVESGGALPDPRDVSFERILAAARTIMAPYTLDVGSLSWWSAYRVGQRVGSHFSRHGERAFLVGDAVHTHSPKAGQGMNTSIQDAYNLGWKLRLVLTQRALVDPEKLLATYETERRPVAQDLIAFDRGYLKLFSSPSVQFETEFLRAMKFTTGLSIRYPASCAVVLPHGVTELGPSLLRADLVPGKRLPDFRAVYQADGTTAKIHDRMRATGQFRVLAFAGDISQQRLLDSLQKLGRYLGDSEAGLGHLTRGSEESKEPMVEVLVVHCAERHVVDFLELEEVFRPWSDAEGYDYWRVFADAESVHEGHGRVYERLEIDRGTGCTVVVRPDGYIGGVIDTNDLQGLGDYFKVIGLLEPAGNEAFL